MENLDRCRIFDSTDFEKLFETTSKKHFRRKFFLREVGDQKVSHRSCRQRREDHGIFETTFKKKLFFGEFKNLKIKIYFGDFKNLKTLKQKIFNGARKREYEKLKSKKKILKTENYFRRIQKTFLKNFIFKF